MEEHWKTNGVIKELNLGGGELAQLVARWTLGGCGFDPHPCQGRVDMFNTYKDRRAVKKVVMVPGKHLGARMQASKIASKLPPRKEKKCCLSVRPWML